MRAGSQESYIDYPFYTTIDLKMTSEKTSYTDSGEPLFYLYPLRFDKRLYYDENRASEGLKKILLKPIIYVRLWGWMATS